MCEVQCLKHCTQWNTRYLNTKKSIFRFVGICDSVHFCRYISTRTVGILGVTGPISRFGFVFWGWSGTDSCFVTQRSWATHVGPSMCVFAMYVCGCGYAFRNGNQQALPTYTVFSWPPQQPRVYIWMLKFVMVSMYMHTYVTKNIVSRRYVESWRFVDVYSWAHRQKGWAGFLKFWSLILNMFN